MQRYSKFLGASLWMLLTFIVWSKATSAQTSKVIAQQLAPAAFAKSEKYHSARLSPDGKHLAVVVTQEGKRRLVVLSSDDFKYVGGMKFRGHDEVGKAYWANNDRIVLTVYHREVWEKAPASYGELYAVNYDGTNPALIYGSRASADFVNFRSKRKSATFGWAEIIDMLPDDKKHILISSTAMSKSKDKLAKVHKLNVYTGAKSRRITQSPIPFARFLTDQQHNLRIVTGTDEHNVNRAYWYKATENDWKEIPRENTGSHFKPLGFDQTGDWLYVFDNHDRDTRALVKMHAVTGERKTIYGDDELSITYAVFDSSGTGVFAVRTDPDYPTYAIIDRKHPEAAMFKSMLQLFEGYEVNLVSRSENGNKNVILVRSDTMPSSFYLFDAAKNTIAPLFNNLLGVKEQQLARTKPVSFTARDGLTIHGYFTRPKDVADKAQIPLVTLVHGGPHGERDYWLYDREVQLLASLGYGVLRVNFRGSGGYGIAFQKAGYHHWGDTMQHDIIDGTRWATENLNINDEKVCIMGASFGGYSALQSATIAPDLFKCVVANVGVYDLEMMYEEGDIPELGFGESYLEMALGNDETTLKAFSPVHRTHLLQAPVLLAHGERDKRVPFEQAEALAEAMEKNNKPFEWFTRRGEAHGYYDEKNRAAYFEAVSAFLGRYLGT